jgi:mono/diheme cytochrome c family protein
MKSIFSFAVVPLILFAFIGLSWNSVPSSSETPAVGKDPSSIPAEVQKIMDNSCLACHGAGGKTMALSRVKMAEWDGYSADKQAQKAAAICKVVTSGKMPPKGYLKENPKAALTKEQIASLCAWSDALNKGKK